MHLAIYACVALMLSIICYYPVTWLANRFGVIDHPTHDKIHKKPIPRLGGLAIFFAFLITVIFSPLEWKDIEAVMLGALAIVLLGVLDDKFTLRPIIKLSGQIIIVLYVMLNGDIVITKLAIPLVGLTGLESFGLLITFCWMIGMINAINLIDGLDGLAAGVTFIALSTMAIMAVMEAQVSLLILCVILIGAIGGFLVFNLPPARIYMGDSGSLFLGYMIAVIPLLGLFKQVTFYGFILPVIILTIPIFDTLLVMVQRALQKQNIFHRDQKHLHYRLLQHGWTHKQTVFIIYGFAMLFSVLSIVIAYVALPWKWMLVLGYFLVIILFAKFIWKISNKKQT